MRAPVVSSGPPRRRRGKNASAPHRAVRRASGAPRLRPLIGRLTFIFPASGDTVAVMESLRRVLHLLRWSRRLEGAPSSPPVSHRARISARQACGPAAPAPTPHGAQQEIGWREAFAASSVPAFELPRSHHRQFEPRDGCSSELAATRRAIDRARAEPDLRRAAPAPTGTAGVHGHHCTEGR